MNGAPKHFQNPTVLGILNPTESSPKKLFVYTLLLNLKNINSESKIVERSNHE